MSDSTHYSFDETRGWHLFLADAYRGGWAWDNPSSSTLGTARLYGYAVTRDENGREVVSEVSRGTQRTYLVPWPGESEANFARRRHLAFYVNIAEPVVDAYVDTVTTKVTRELGTLSTYLGSLDGDGQTWSEHVACVARAAATHGACAVIIEPPLRNTSTTREQEIAAGVSLRARVIAPQSWAWVAYDSDGVLTEFAYADSAPVGGETAAGTQRATVWRYTRTRWERHSLAVRTDAGISSLASAVSTRAPDETGDYVPAMQGRVPVVFAYHRRDESSASPSGRSLAASPAAIGRQIYQILSQVEDTQRRAPPFLAMPTSARGGLEPEVQVKAGPDSTVPIPEGAGPPAWVTFPSESLSDLRSHALFLVALAYRVSGLEVQADQSAQVQSGEALRVRSRDFESRALKFSQDCAAYERRALGLAALALGQTTSDVRVTYPRRFVLGDSAEMLSAALLVLQSLAGNLGDSGIVASVRQALGAALSLDDEQLDKIVREVEEKIAEPQPQTRNEVFAYDYEAGLVTANEARRTKGFDDVDGGDVPITVWVAKTRLDAARYDAEAARLRAVALATVSDSDAPSSAGGE